MVQHRSHVRGASLSARADTGEYTLGKSHARIARFRGSVATMLVNGCIVLMVSGSNLACSTEHVVTRSAAADFGYTTGFPGPNDGFDIEAALSAVQMLSSVGYYKQASFSNPTAWPKNRKLSADVWEMADTVSTFTNEVFGTGTVVQFSGGRVAVVTSAHVVSFRDTITTYHDIDSVSAGIRAIAILVKQRNYLVEIPGADALEVLARDDKLDIAILGQPITTDDMEARVSTLPTGAAGDLKWGSFVYAFGYPVGFKMVSSGLVSQPMRNNSGSFLTNVVFNRGMSGAAVLAARPGSSVLEWVGVMTSGAATTEYHLTPEPKFDDDEPVRGEPYEGDSFVSKVQRIRYGVSTSVSIEAVKRLALTNRSVLDRRGYELTILE